jgi:hypothetical protein
MADEVRVRDPVHNFISLRDLEVKLLATPLLQRLRGIRQLAMASLVYPGALHTRFDHTLGVCHVAGLMAEQLNLSPDQTELVRLAALLHDLGHGPFSHVSEHLLERYAERTKLPASQKTAKIHELITAHLIEHDQDLGRLLSADKRQQIVRLLSTGYGSPILRSIVSGPLDADKQDYLLRDSYFCGVKYGVFDIHQLHRSLIAYGDSDEKELMINPDGVHALEQFVLAKYYLTTNVYRHRVRLVTDQMIIRAIELGIEHDQMDELRRIFTYDDSEQFFERYVVLDDARFLFQFDSRAKPRTKCGDLLSRLQTRQLHKRVFSARIETFDEDIRPILQDISKPEKCELRKKVEESAAAELTRILGRNDNPVNALEVIVHAFDIQSVREMSRNDEAAIMIARRPEPASFDQCSTLFASINESYSEVTVEIYAPITWDTRTDRSRILREVAEPLRAAISAAIKDALQKGDKP